MAVIIKTAGATDANSYADVADADALLLEERVGGEAWDAVADKSAALIMATQQLERLRWKGSRAVATQALHFPASGATYRDGRAVPETIVPDGVIRGTIELAFWFSQGDRLTVSGGDLLEDIEAGPIKLKFRDLPGTGGILSSMPDIAKGHLNEFTSTGVGGGSGFRRVVR